MNGDLNVSKSHIMTSSFLENGEDKGAFWGPSKFVLAAWHRDGVSFSDRDGVSIWARDDISLTTGCNVIRRLQSLELSKTFKVLRRIGKTVEGNLQMLVWTAEKTPHKRLEKLAGTFWGSPFSTNNNAQCCPELRILLEFFFNYPICSRLDRNLSVVL